MAIDRHLVVAGRARPDRAAAGGWSAPQLQSRAEIAPRRPVRPRRAALGRLPARRAGRVPARGVAVPALDVVLERNLPLGGGLSSSAALEVATATADRGRRRPDAGAAGQGPAVPAGRAVGGRPLRDHGPAGGGRRAGGRRAADRLSERALRRWCRWPTHDVAVLVTNSQRAPRPGRRRIRPPPPAVRRGGPRCWGCPACGRRPPSSWPAPALPPPLAARARHVAERERPHAGVRRRAPAPRLRRRRGAAVREPPIAARRLPGQLPRAGRPGGHRPRAGPGGGVWARA